MEVNVYCDRIGYVITESVKAEEGFQTLESIAGILTKAEEQHKGHCGNKREPCDAEAIRLRARPNF